MFCGEERKESHSTYLVTIFTYLYCGVIISQVTVPVARMDVYLGDQLYKFPSEDLAELEVSHCIE